MLYSTQLKLKLKFELSLATRNVNTIRKNTQKNVKIEEHTNRKQITDK